MARNNGFEKKFWRGFAMNDGVFVVEDHYDGLPSVICIWLRVQIRSVLSLKVQ